MRSPLVVIVSPCTWLGRRHVRLTFFLAQLQDLFPDLELPEEPELITTEAATAPLTEISAAIAAALPERVREVVLGTQCPFAYTPESEGLAARVHMVLDVGDRWAECAPFVRRGLTSLPGAEDVQFVNDNMPVAA